MDSSKLTLKYKHYVLRARQANTSSKVRDVLYSFINRYRKLGSMSTLTEQGYAYVVIISAFQQVIGKYHLRMSLSSLSETNLRHALIASVNAIKIWYYVASRRAKTIRINVKKYRNNKDAIERIKGVENNIKKNHDLCLSMNVSRYNVTMVIVPHHKIVVI